MKRVLVFGGAVLLLAACDSATAPGISRHDGPAAYSTKKTTTTGTSSTTTTTTSTASEEGGCGKFYHTGPGDSVWVPGSCGGGEQ